MRVRGPAPVRSIMAVMPPADVNAYNASTAQDIDPGAIHPELRRIARFIPRQIVYRW